MSSGRSRKGASAWATTDKVAAARKLPFVATGHDLTDSLALIVSPDGAQGSVRLHQDARVHAGLFDGDEQADLLVAPGRRVYLHVGRGSVEINGQRLAAGDAAKFTDEQRFRLSGGQQAEVLVFDLP